MTESGTPRALVQQYAESLLALSGIEQPLVRALEQVRDYFETAPEAGGPFLTVLLRTQGQKLEALRDALLCLVAQTDQDFEVIVLDHDSEADAAAEVKEIAGSQPASFAPRVRVIEVTGGTRSRPLNVGIAAATGRYIAVFDDDDLLFGDWVERFHEHASGRRMLRSQVANQRVVPETWPNGDAGYRSLSWPNAEYNRTFDQLDHIQVNHSPFMSMAFPRYLFTKLGLAFDDDLVVCEDWDVIVRGSLLVGVDDVPALTAIYRRWEGGPSSYTDHSSIEWRRSEKRVADRVNSVPFLLPAGSEHRIRELLESDQSRIQYEMLFTSRSWRWTAPLRSTLSAAFSARRTALDALRRVRRR